MHDFFRRLVLPAGGFFLGFVAIGLWQMVVFQLRPIQDFYQPQGYIEKVKKLIAEGKLVYTQERSAGGYKWVIRRVRFAPEDDEFYRRSWLKEDIEAFNEGDKDVFLVDRGKLQGINIYRHRVESPLADDWNWWGRIYSQSAEGYAYLWNSRRTLKLYRPPISERAMAKAGQSEFREVVYGRGHLFQTGMGIAIKGRMGNRIADVYALGENIVLKSYVNKGVFLNGHPLPRGEEQRLEEGDLVQIYFDRNTREEFLFHDFSRKPLSFVNVVNGRLVRTNLDRSFQLISHLAGGVDMAVRKSKKEKAADFDIHLALDEDLSGLTQTALENFVSSQTRASCTILDALNGKILALASTTKNEKEVNGNLKLHPVGSSTKIFLAAAALQESPDLLNMEIGPHPAGEEKNLVGYELKEGYKLRSHRTGINGTTDFITYIAKSCNRYHAILMALALARDSAASRGVPPDFHGMLLTQTFLDRTNGAIYVGGEELVRRPDLSYFLSPRPDGQMECTNLDNSELALNMERFFDVKRKFVEGSSDFFSADPWNILFARLALQQQPEITPIFYPIMPQTVNLGLNLNVDFRLDFISILFGGATNRWNNIKLAEAISRLVTNRKVQARFVDHISDDTGELKEKTENVLLGLNPEVHTALLRGMEAVLLPGGTAGDLYPLLADLRSRVSGPSLLEFYGKTGTPFREEIRKGGEETYSSVLLLTAVLRNPQTKQIQDALSFAIYIEDQGEHKAVDFVKQVLTRVLMTRGWIR